MLITAGFFKKGQGLNCLLKLLTMLFWWMLHLSFYLVLPGIVWNNPKTKIWMILILSALSTYLKVAIKNYYIDSQQLIW